MLFFLTFETWPTTGRPWRGSQSEFKALRLEVGPVGMHPFAHHKDPGWTNAAKDHAHNGQVAHLGDECSRTGPKKPP